MARKCVLRVMEKSVCPGRVYVENWSSSILKKNVSSSSVFNQKEEETVGNGLKHSPYIQFNRAQRISSASTQRDARPLVLIRSGTQSYEEISQSQLLHCSWPGSNISILGNSVGLSFRPVSQLNTGRRMKLPQLAKASRDGEISTRKLCILTAIKPSNVDNEKYKFFKSDFRYNPQFEYSNPASPQVLEKHSQASDRFLTQAVRIMELALRKYGNYERASMTVVNGKPTLTINISMAREQWLEGMLRHEIGTHYFRSINNHQQPWNSGAKRKTFGLKPVNPTEEGLASIHSVLFRRDPWLWRAALLYYTVHQAAHMSFSQLFQELARFVHDPVTRWDYCVRAKRGQTDTSQPGCFSKDQVYLDGILKILRHRKKIDFQLLTALGKVSYEDVERLKSLAVTENVRIPHFLQDQVRYTEQLRKIMAVNRLTDEELQVLI
ncbi:hypothetical protein Baya_2488 [Bagarius yarrelli]|uniref:Uncharacterized protein n=1 Tax=Bagarius yarrelli TaxID=175774 RepID=A0A556TP46_BAGYA|nr:hypothetical protein Baya_2488 [Bagarius yarrelli]